MNKAVYITSSNNKFGYIKENEQIKLNLQSCLYVDVNSGTKKKQNEFHSNPIYHCHYIISGEGEFELADKTRYSVSENQFIIIPRGKEHRISGESLKFSKLRIVFDLEIKKDSENGFYKTFEKELQKFNVYDFSDDMNFIINMLMENNEQKKHGYGAIIEAFTYALIIETASAVTGNKLSTKKSGKKDERVEKAMDYIIRNVSKPLVVKDVASYVFLSEKQLTRIFMESENYTPANFIRYSKFNLAVKLLLDTDMSIGEIAEKTGFATISAFVNFFVRIENKTPTQYRKTMRILTKEV